MVYTVAVNRERRKELGKMILDVTKYLLTVGIIGSTITASITLPMAVLLFVLALVMAVIGFYVIPKKEEK